MNKIISFFWEIIKITVLVLLIVVPVRYFLFQPFIINGQSMEPNFKQGDYLIIDEISYRIKEPQRGDIIVFRYPNDPSQRYIKRIVGLPGEIIEVRNNKVIIFSNGTSQTLDESKYLSSNVLTTGDVKTRLEKDQYFVMGDNRSFSFDSRKWGVVPKKNIIGKVFLRLWPINNIAEYQTQTY